MSELTAQSDDSAKDHSLRRDVRSLGALLGRVLVEQAGKELFDAVEELRRLMIRASRAGGAQPAAAARGELMARAQAMISRNGSGPRLSSHQSICNLFRTGQSGGDQPSQTPPARPPTWTGNTSHLPGSFHGTLLRMKEAGISGERRWRRFARSVVTPVFTAHPTEVARQTVLLKRRRIAEQLERLDRLPLTAGEALRLRTGDPRRNYCAVADRRSSTDQAHRRR